MNSSKKDYGKLYQLQDKFLSWWFTLDLPFYLTGGTALGRFYLNHRFSEDLDFFTNANPRYADNEIDVEQRLNSFPVEWLENVNWLDSPADIVFYKKTLQQIADDFLMGKDNSLGLDKISIQAAKPLPI